jgi:hypothetical protein
MSQTPPSPAHRSLLFVVILSLGVAWMIYLGVNSPGTSLHDEITHYFIARESWTDPLRILDIWGRPGNTLFYMLPSLISLGARRWWAVITCIAIILITTRSAARLGLRQLWLIPLTLYLQPWFVQLGFNSITQIPFMLALTVGIDRWIAGRRGWASLCFGLLPLIRHEGLALTAAWIGYLVILGIVWWREQRNAKAGALHSIPWYVIVALIPMTIWNALFFAFYGQAASGNLLNIRPTDIYGSGDWLHFLGPTIVNVGIGVFVLSLIRGARLWREQRGALVYGLPALLYFITHTLIYRFGLFASGGYPLFLLPMAPTFALLAAFAIARLPAWMEHFGARSPIIHNRPALMRASVVGVIGALLLLNLVAMLRVRPWALQPNEIAAQQAADWLVVEGYQETPVFSTHVWFLWVYEGRGELVEVPGGSKLTPEQVPSGALVLWDINYGDLNGIELATLRAEGSGFSELQGFFGDQMVLFRKDEVSRRNKAPNVRTRRASSLWCL